MVVRNPSHPAHCVPTDKWLSISQHIKVPNYAKFTLYCIIGDYTGTMYNLSLGCYWNFFLLFHAFLFYRVNPQLTPSIVFKFMACVQMFLVIKPSQCLIIHMLMSLITAPTACCKKSLTQLMAVCITGDMRCLSRQILTDTFLTDWQLICDYSPALNANPPFAVYYHVINSLLPCNKLRRKNKGAAAWLHHCF